MSFDDTPSFMTGATERDTSFPEFRMEPVLNKFKSDHAGHPVYEEFEFVTIRVPGDRKTEWDGRVNDTHKRRWPQAYAAFKSQQEAPTEGVPLTEWPAITRSQVLELAAANCKTVEQLANLPDEHLNKSVSMGGYALREKAKRYLEQAAGSAVAERLAAEKAVGEAKMEVMQQTIEALKAEVEKLSANKAEPGS